MKGRSLNLLFTTTLLFYFNIIGEIQAESNYDIRVTGYPDGHEWKGRVEIYYSNQWGSICDDSFDNNDAKVVCRQLGYNSARDFGTSQYEGTGKIWMDDVSCSGSEYRLADCPHAGWGSHNCGHSEDVFVDCTEQNEYDLRLIGGPNEWEGRLEIFYSSRWGTVCDDLFDEIDAEIACWDLGYSGYSSFRAVDTSERATAGTTIWLDNVQCGGTHSKLHSCSHSSWGINNCDDTSHKDDVYLICENTIPTIGDLRLVGGNSEFEGRLEIYQNERWGTICSYRFNSIDGNVACWQLGYSGYSTHRNANSDERAPHNYQIWLDYLRCTGTETRLEQCNSYGWGKIHQCDTHYQDENVYLTCQSEPENGPPDVTGCPSNIEVTTELGTTETTATWNEPTATDASTITITRSNEPGTSFEVGITHVAYIYTDTRGYTTACSFTVNVLLVDTTPPTVVFCPNETHTTTELGTNTTHGTLVKWNEPKATDLSGEPRAIPSQEPSSEFPIGETVVSYIFVDASNNTANCSFTLFVDTVDTTPPLVSRCPQNIPSVGGRHVSWEEPTAIDLSDNVTIWSSHSPGLFVIDDTEVVYSFTDSSKNTAYCRFAINTIYDTTPPAISGCPNDTYVESEIGSLTTPVYWSPPSATDDNERVVLLHASHTPGQSFPVGTSSVRYVFGDDSYNKAICNFSVSVSEGSMAPPTIESCPSDVYVDMEPGKSSNPVFWDTPLASDLSGNFSLVSASHHSGDQFPPGRTRVMYSFTDGNRIIVHCTFYVNVQKVFVGNDTYVYVDTSPPVIINCPLHINKLAEMGTLTIPVIWSEPSAVDERGFVVEINKTHKPGDAFAVGTTTNISYVFTDDSYNKATCNFSVTVTRVDTTPPTIDYCPDVITETVETGVTTASVSWTEPRATDISGNVTLSPKSRIPTSFSTLRETQVVYIFVDDSGNEAVCNFFISFVYVDTTPPIITSCPSDIYSTIELGTPEVSVWWNTPIAFDSSGIVRTSSTHTPGHKFSVGSTIVNYQFLDETHNFSECNFTIIVETEDTTPPVLQFCPDDIAETAEDGVETKPVYWSEPIAADLSGNVSLSFQNHFSGDNFTMGRTKITYIYVDGSGNSESCTFDITVFSRITGRASDILDCPSDISTVIEAGSFATPVSWREPSDIDGNVTLLVKTHSPGENFGFGTTTVSYLFVDESHNMATCTFRIVVTIVDSTPPVITYCPSNIQSVAEIGSKGAFVTWNPPIATDLSGTVRSESSHKPGQMFSFGITLVSYVFQDQYANIAECNFTVEVQGVDTTPPKVEDCPFDLNDIVELGKTNKVMHWSEPQVSDVSGNVTLVGQSHFSADLFPLGETSISYLFVDGAGNSAWCNFTIRLAAEEDTRSPTIMNCPSSEIFANAGDDLNSRAAVSWTDPTAIDESSNVTLLVKTHSSGQMFRVGSTTVIYMFADSSNNIASCTFDVTVTTDKRPPEVLNCPSDIRTSIEVGESLTPVYWIEPFAFDGPGQASVTYRSHISGQIFPINETTVSYVFGNDVDRQAFCNFSVIVNQVDTTPPKLTKCPSDIYKTLEAGTPGVGVSWDEPSASDKSGIVNLVENSHTPGDMFNVGSSRISYTFADGSSNRVMCDFSVIVTEVDTTEPTIISCPNNKTAQVDPGNLGTTVSWEEPKAEDASGYTMLLVQTHAPGTFFAVGTTIVSYIYKDKGSNMNKCSFSVTVLGDNKTSSGVFNCPSNIITTVEPGKRDTTVTWEEPFAVNLSPSAKVSSNHGSNESFPMGSTEIVYTFEDADGFTEYCNFTVVVAQHGKSDNPADSSRNTGGSKVVSVTALTLCLLIIVFVIIVVILLAYIRKRNRDNNTQLDGLMLSASSSSLSIF